SVIHGLGGEQDLRKMGGLAPKMVTTTITMTVGAVGLAGLPPFAGFFSKDEILHAAYSSHHRLLWAFLLLGAFMTAFYSFRLIFLTFFGGPRMSREVAHHVHESPWVMTLPLVVLAVLTFLAGWAVGMPSEAGTRFARFLTPVFPPAAHEWSGAVTLMLAVLSTIAASAGIVLAWLPYAAASGTRRRRAGSPRWARRGRRPTTRSGTRWALSMEVPGNRESRSSNSPWPWRTG